MSTRQLEKGQRVQSGIISLAMAEGEMFKRSLICRTGNFKGIHGPVPVTAELLNRLAAKYNKARAKPANKFDYAPILVDHNRMADLTKGRLMADLSVEPWEDPETGVTEQGLFGSLRVDNKDAQSKVLEGTYSQISLCFDDETDDIYEVSFVAVEAARRSQALASGEDKTMDLKVQLETTQQQLTELNARYQGVALAMKTAVGARKEICLALNQGITSSETDVTALQGQVKALGATLRTTALSASLKGFIRAGKMSKAEFDKLNVQELSALPENALRALMASYDGRTPSPDLVQHGQSGAAPVQLRIESSSPEAIRKLMDAQMKGVSLSAEDEEKAKAEKAAAAAAAGKDSGQGGSDIGIGDIDEVIKAADSMGGVVEKISAALKSMSGQLKKLMEQDKDPAGQDSK